VNFFQKLIVSLIIANCFIFFQNKLGFADIQNETNTEGTLKWRFKAGEPYHDPHTGSVGIVTSPAIDDDGTIYILNNRGTLYAVNSDGTKKWFYETGDSPEVGGPGFVSPSIGHDGTIYVKGGSGKLFAFTKSGQVKWVYEDYITGGADFSYGLPIDPEGAVILPEWEMRAINPNNTVKWIITESLYTLSTPGIGPDGSIYTISNDGIMRARDNRGILKWSYDCQGWTYGNGVAVDNEGIIYFGNFATRKLYAIYPDGREKWTFFAGKQDYGTGEINSSPIIGYYGDIYVVAGFYLYCLTNNGKERWKVNIEPGVTGEGSSFSTPALGKDGTVFAMSFVRGILYAINEYGKIKWEYKLDDWSRSSPTIGSDGTIYIGGYDGYLYAIRSDCGGLAQTEWPMFARNPKHTAYQSGNIERLIRKKSILPSVLLLLHDD
jgi:outer membrane protein assembly factor BamB